MGPGSRSDDGGVRVLRLLGYGRSGTTALGSVLGRRPGAIYVGETSQAWKAFSTPGWTCGCGELIGSCRFWSEVRALAFGAGGSEEFPRLEAIWQARLRIRPRAIWRLRRAPDALGNPERRWAGALAELYRAIASVSGAELIVDSSSAPPAALAAIAAPGITTCGLHLVRDPRGVAHSERRSAAALPGRTALGRPPSAARVAIRWQVRNLLAERMVGTRLPAYARISYEEFCSRPARAFEAAARVTGHRDLALGAGEEVPALDVGADHAIDGNPHVLGSRGRRAIRLDERWRREMPRGPRLMAMAFSLPMRRHYGYRR